MSLVHAILGFLQNQPMTGYDLKTLCFDQSIAHFWPADQAQIYRTLDKLNEQGWVESEVQFQADRPNRKVYSITNAGRAEFQQWLVSEQALPLHREPFLVQLFFSGRLSREQLIAHMENQRRAHEALLAGYERIVIPTECEDPAELRALKLQAMTLDLGKRTERNYIAWLDDCIAVIEGFET